ncbi:hypothetical protein F443_10765 [Phytophthora nicotianae P1569]|uniref:Uncharacterized protein n=1 Tax=Phytophthora nicotianae P1569 TaxID=1317065 RepID=V9EZ51_PHYNI|nr:hypothetical protein F443_10765 [Phytophthora nicotianae P1569]
MPQSSTDVQDSPLVSFYLSRPDLRRRVAAPPSCATMLSSTLSAAVLDPPATVFLLLSSAIATSTVCSFMTSTCSYEYACLTNRIRHRLLTLFKALENSIGAWPPRHSHRQLSTDDDDSVFPGWGHEARVMAQVNGELKEYGCCVGVCHPIGMGIIGTRSVPVALVDDE